MPTWNCAAFLPDAIDSVLAQSGPELELIVVDDGSSDDTAAVLARYGSRIRVISLPHSGGPSGPRNRGIAAARGDFVAFCDADDVMRAGKIQRAIELFAANPELDLLCTSFRVVDKDGLETHADFLADYVSFRVDLQPTTDPRMWLLPGEAAYDHLLRINFVGTSSVVCRRQLFASAGLFDEELRNSGDIDIWRRIAWHGHTFGFLDEVWHTYRVRTGSISGRGGERLPYLIAANERQLPCCRTEAQRRGIRHDLASMHLGYGWYLRRSGRAAEAVTAYVAALRLRPSLRGLLGLTRSCLQRGLRRDAHGAGRPVAPAHAATPSSAAADKLRVH